MIALTEPCHLLIAATLEQAIHDKDRDYFADDSPRLFGFRWCCAMLDLDSERVRNRLLSGVDHVRSP